MGKSHGKSPLASRTGTTGSGTFGLCLWIIDAVASLWIISQMLLHLCISPASEIQCSREACFILWLARPSLGHVLMSQHVGMAVGKRCRFHSGSKSKFLPLLGTHPMVIPSTSCLYIGGACRWLPRQRWQMFTQGWWVISFQTTCINFVILPVDNGLHPWKRLRSA